jgi:hypothetical protein
MLFAWFLGKAPEVVVGESDVDAALAHLRRLPYRKNQPLPWDRKWLIALVRETVGRRPRLGQCFDIAPGVFGIVKPLAYDGTRAAVSDMDLRLQVVLAVRRSSTGTLIGL